MPVHGPNVSGRPELIALQEVNPAQLFDSSNAGKQGEVGILATDGMEGSRRSGIKGELKISAVKSENLRLRRA